MVEYSEQESKLFGVDFGRLIIPAGFNNWELVEEEVLHSKCKYIRARIQNPKSAGLEKLGNLGRKAHLLEILRLYSSEDLLVTPFENEHFGLNFELVNERTM